MKRQSRLAPLVLQGHRFGSIMVCLAIPRNGEDTRSGGPVSHCWSRPSAGKERDPGGLVSTEKVLSDDQTVTSAHPKCIYSDLASIPPHHAPPSKSTTGQFTSGSGGTRLNCRCILTAKSSATSGNRNTSLNWRNSGTRHPALSETAQEAVPPQHALRPSTERAKAKPVTS